MIAWFFDKESKLKTGIGQYSDVLIKELENNERVKRYYITRHFGLIGKYFYLLLMYPLKIVMLPKNDKVVVYEEGMSILGLLSIFKQNKYGRSTFYRRQLCR